MLVVTVIKLKINKLNLYWKKILYLNIIQKNYYEKCTKTFSRLPGVDAGFV